MTVITLVAIAIIGAILALLWPKIQARITGMWGGIDTNGQRGCQEIGGTWDATNNTCIGGQLQ